MNQIRLCIIRISGLFSKTKMLLLIKATANNINNIHIKYSVTYFLFCFTTFLSVNEGILRVQTKKLLHWQDKWWHFFYLHLHFFYNTIYYTNINQFQISQQFWDRYSFPSSLTLVLINFSHNILIYQTVLHLLKFDKLGAFQNKSFTFLT